MPTIHEMDQDIQDSVRDLCLNDLWSTGQEWFARAPGGVATWATRAGGITWYWGKPLGFPGFVASWRCAECRRVRQANPCDARAALAIPGRAARACTECRAARAALVDCDRCARPIPPPPAGHHRLCARCAAAHAEAVARAARLAALDTEIVHPPAGWDPPDVARPHQL